MRDPFEIDDDAGAAELDNTTPTHVMFQCCPSCKRLIAKSNEPFAKFLGDKRLCHTCLLGPDHQYSPDETARKERQRQTFLALFGEDLESWPDMIERNKR